MLVNGKVPLQSQPWERSQSRKATLEWPPRSMTDRFFIEGERREVEGWDDAALTQASPDPRQQFTSFDRIPRRRAPLVLIGFVGMLVVGGVAWKSGIMAWALAHAGVSSTLFASAPEPVAPSVEPALPAAIAVPVSATPETGAEALVEVAPANVPFTEVEQIAAVVEPPAVGDPPSEAKDERVAVAGRAKPARHGRGARHGYVWSPAAASIVLATPSPETEAAPPQSETDSAGILGALPTIAAPSLPPLPVERPAAPTEPPPVDLPPSDALNQN